MAARRISSVIVWALLAVAFSAGPVWAQPCRQVEHLARAAWDQVDELDLEFDRNFRPAAEYRMLLNTTDRMLDVLEDIEDDAACGKRWDRIECRLNELARRSRTLHLTLDRMDDRYGGCAHAWRGREPYCSHRAHALLHSVDMLLAQLQDAVACMRHCDDRGCPAPSLNRFPLPAPPAPVPPPIVSPWHGAYHSPHGPSDRFGVQLGVDHGRPSISFGNSSFAIRLGGR